jgi:hypothetical protein
VADERVLEGLAATVRRRIAQRLRSDERVAAVAVTLSQPETGIAQSTLFRSKRQALIDVGVIEGNGMVGLHILMTAARLPFSSGIAKPAQWWRGQWSLYV